MKNFKLVLSLSVFFLLHSCNERNSENEHESSSEKLKDSTLQYASTDIYSRGLLRIENDLFVGNSDGSLYQIDLLNWTSQTIEKAFDFTELRDLAWTNNRLIGIQSGENGKIFQLKFGEKCQLLDTLSWKGIFMDGIDFSGRFGFLMGDPVRDTFSLYHTSDGGINWKPCEGKLIAQPGEAGFAGSGTNVQVFNDSTFIFISGGSQSRFFKSTNRGKSWEQTTLPFNTGEGVGAFSIYFKDDMNGVVVGGNYLEPEKANNASFYTKDGGKTWQASEIPLNGYRCCVHYQNNVYYACGSNGIDYSKDQGKSWKSFQKGVFFSMQSDTNYLYVTGKNATLHRFQLIQ
jgi:photosystem II stability/assembly factor-like uncharacterized protein